MPDTLDLTCHVCGHIGIADGSDGFYYCLRCGSQAEDIIDTAPDEEDNPASGNYSTALRRQRPAASVTVKPEPFSQPQSQFWESLKTLDDDGPAVNTSLNRVKKEEEFDGVGPTGPSDFGSDTGPIDLDDYYSELRMRYVMGLQMMIQLQTKALVEEFNVSPLICGLAGTIWLRYVASTRVFDDDWADEVINESESQKEGLREGFRASAKYRAEPHNIHGQRAVMLWYRSLSKTIPLSHTLVISYLVCHFVREAVLPTDIVKWSLEGKLPYFTAFSEINGQLGSPLGSCPLSCSFMFRPSESISLYKLEAQAASIARKIGLELPPVNFYAIASRYLKKLSLDVGKILPSVCRLYEWSLPSELWLSANEFRLPTRVCVLSMVIVAIRILYNIHGFGYWEKSFSSADSSENGGRVEGSELEAMELLRGLEARYNGLKENYGYSKDLPTYLQYCKDVVFAGLEPSCEDMEEEKLIEELWKYYQDKKDSLTSNNHDCNGVSQPKRCRDHDALSSGSDSKRSRENGSPHSGSSYDEDQSQCSVTIDDGHSISGKDAAIKRLKSNMEENRFCYIPPRVNIKRRDYLQYARKKGKGAYIYAAHADYYILVRSCARVAGVDVRVMHCGVMNFERRLGWLEKRIDHCLSQLGSEGDYCELCCEEMKEDEGDGSIDVSKLNL